MAIIIIIIIIIIIKIVHEVLWPACEAIPESTRATDLIRSSSSSDGITGESACSVQQLQSVSEWVDGQTEWGNVTLSLLVVLMRSQEQPMKMDDERMQLTSSAAGTPAILIRKVTTFSHQLY